LLGRLETDLRFLSALHLSHYSLLLTVTGGAPANVNSGSRNSNRPESDRGAAGEQSVWAEAEWANLWGGREAVSMRLVDIFRPYSRVGWGLASVAGRTDGAGAPPSIHANALRAAADHALQ